MTAEIAIMNKTAVALAADSAVTIGKGQKIYNTANKLFTLSKYQPVGIMIYGSADLIGVPWESIIKTFREDLGKKRFDFLKEYCAYFINYINDNQLLFSETAQKQYVFDSVSGYCRSMKNDIDEQVKGLFKDNAKVNLEQVVDIATNKIKKYYDLWKQADYLPDMNEDFCNEIVRKYEEEFNKAMELVFEKLPLNLSSVNQLKTICSNIFCKNMISNNHSGIVIAGFGEKDIFPSIISLRVDGYVNNKLKYMFSRQGTINEANNTIIIPFAQQEMVATFMEGIDPDFKKTLEAYITIIFNKYPEIIVNNINIPEEEKKDLLNKLKKVTSSLFEDFNSKLKSYQKDNHVNPVIRTVAFLPKDELAAMAESLVNLTSFKRRITFEAETVGGPIDVAVISKGDGFIWIKRKHYFDGTLNYQFFSNYYLKEKNNIKGNEENMKGD